MVEIEIIELIAWREKYIDNIKNAFLLHEKNRKGAGNYIVIKNKMIKLNKCLINYI
jgi:hypothetical protein